jgi:hypothetical protein
MQGNPVLPITIRKVSRRRGKMASKNESIESGVTVNPTLLNADDGVKILHHGRPTPASFTTLPYLSARIIHGSKQTTPKIVKKT